jgi:PatG C-terminal
MTEHPEAPQESTTAQAPASAMVLPAGESHGAHPEPPPSLPIEEQAVAAYDLDGVGSAPPPATSSGIAFVYALGQIEPRFPTLAVEKEFAQVAGQTDASGLTDRQALQALLSESGNRYLARQLCWVLTVEGLDTYILQPRVPEDVELLIRAVRETPRRNDIDVVIGALGPIAPPELCNALMVPIVVFDNVYSFDVDSLLDAIPRPSGAKAGQWQAAIEEIFARITQMNDNAGATDADRALNYLSVRHPGIYHLAADKFAANSSLTAVDVRHSRLASTRNVVEVIFAFTDRATDVTEKHFLRVDVTEEFPFLVSKLAPYFEREA